MATGDIGTALVNQTRAYASNSYKQAVPLLTQANLTQVGDAILNFTPIYNEFINVFFNKVTLEIIDTRSYQNPFRSITKGGSPLGGVIQNTHVNPAKPMPYDVNATSRLLQNYRPDVAVEYYNINRKDLFAVTRARQELELAFTSFENLDRFFSEIIDSLYNGNEIREFELYKSLLASAYLEDVIRKVPIKTPTDKDTAVTFLAALQEYSLAFSFPSANYNNFQARAAAKGYSVAPRVTWTPQDRQVIIMDSKLQPIIGLYVQSSAFQEQYTRLAGRILYVDNFAVTGLLAIIADDAWLQVRDSKREFRDFENGATLTLNSFFHVWQYYNVCTWANAMALYDPDAKPIDIEVDGNTKDFVVSVGIDTSATATVKVEYDGTDYSDSAYIDFICSTNNVVAAYNPRTKEIKVVTNKHTPPESYQMLMVVTINVNGTPKVDSSILTIEVGD